jgi:preprotein translocase subunit SecY
MASAAEQLAANFNFSAFSKATELKNRLVFTLLALVVARLGTYIPMPGIDASALAQQIQQQQGGLLDVFNLLAGGAIERMAIFALGIMPYISSSIIMQLMATVSPTLEQLKKEGEAGRKQMNQYTRWHGAAVDGSGLCDRDGSRTMGHRGHHARHGIPPLHRDHSPAARSS